MNIEKKDIYQRVTDQIVKAIEEGTENYRMPWRMSGGFSHSPVNAVNKRRYRGINILVLWAVAQEKGYKSGIWATYKQWQELGAQVRHGEKSANIVFWKFLDQEVDSDSESQETLTRRRIPMARDYWVFNAEQVDNYQSPDSILNTREERIKHVDEFFRAVGVKVKHGGNGAFYRPGEDAVFIPPFNAFKEPLYYYSVLSHETIHWTGAPQRLNRDLSNRFGSEAYAMEELVAELGAAFLCSELALPTDPRLDHAPYIGSWLKALRNDKRAIFTAAAKAQVAADYLTGKTTTAEVGE